MNTNNNKFENEAVEQDVTEFVENVKKDEGYTPNVKKFQSFIEWRSSTPTGTYTDWKNAQQ